MTPIIIRIASYLMCVELLQGEHPKFVTGTGRKVLYSGAHVASAMLFPGLYLVYGGILALRKNHSSSS